MARGTINIDTAGTSGVVGVAIEMGAKQCFARALEWPGWCRRGRTELEALEALHDYASRYAHIVSVAGVPFDADPEYTVLERLKGNATTDFGAPSAEGIADQRPLVHEELDRWIALLRASWHTLDEVAAHSSEQLVKGPRGGGRDRTGVLNHVLEAERAYGPKLGVRWKRVDAGDIEAVAGNRELVVRALQSAGIDKAGSDDPNDRIAASWSTRYWIHRTAWHVVDHVWEIEDKRIGTSPTDH